MGMEMSQSPSGPAVRHGYGYGQNHRQKLKRSSDEDLDLTKRVSTVIRIMIPLKILPYPTNPLSLCSYRYLLRLSTRWNFNFPWLTPYFPTPTYLHRHQNGKRLGRARHNNRYDLIQLNSTGLRRAVLDGPSDSAWNLNLSLDSGSRAGTYLPEAASTGFDLSSNKGGPWVSKVYNKNPLIFWLQYPIYLFPLASFS